MFVEQFARWLAALRGLACSAAAHGGEPRRMRAAAAAAATAADAASATRSC